MREDERRTLARTVRSQIDRAMWREDEAYLRDLALILAALKTMAEDGASVLALRRAQDGT